jgi:membrane protease YdiL (CAAX protease family)
VPNINEVTPLPTLEDPSFTYPGDPWTKDRSQPNDPDNPAWGVGAALIVWFASILLVVFMPLVFLIPYASYRGIHIGSANSLPALVEFATNDKTALLLQIVALLPSHLLTFLLVWALVTRLGKQSFWAAIGWGWARGFRLWLCILLGVLLFGVGSVIARLIGAEQPTKLEQLIESSLPARYAISFLAVFTAPFAEEFIYRGVLYAALRKTVGEYVGLLLTFVSGVKLDQDTRDRLGISGAVVLVLALFTLIHVPQYWPNLGVIAAVALLSIVLTLVRAYSGRLLPCIVIHLVFNGVQALLLILEPYVHRLSPTPEQVAPTAGLVLTLINLRF